jgi:hypothetical protein
VDEEEELHKHRYWDMFQDYSKLLESKLEVFVEKHNLTAHTFYDQLLEAQTSDPMAKQIIQYLLGATEYRRFVDLLIDRKMFHFGMGGPIGIAVGTDGSIVEGIDEGKTEGSSDKVNGSEMTNGSSKTGEEQEDIDENPDFGRKVSSERLVSSSVGGKESTQDEQDAANSRKK